MQAILWRLENKDYTEIAKRLNRTNDTITQWVKRRNREGYDGVIDKPRSGRPQTLSPSEEKEIVDTVKESARITCKILRFKILNEFGKELTIGAINAMLHKHNLSWKKPRKKDYRQNEQERRQYQKTLKKKTENLPPETMVWYLDEVFFGLDCILSYTWMPMWYRLFFQEIISILP